MNKLKSLIISALALLALGCDMEARNYFNPEFNRASKIKYQKDPVEEDFWQTPKETEKRGIGDCEDHAFYLEDLLRQSGKFSNELCECSVAIGHHDGADGFFSPDVGHVWVECMYKKNGKDKGILYILDSSAGIIKRKSYFKDKSMYIEPDASIMQPYIEEKMDELKKRVEAGK